MKWTVPRYPLAMLPNGSRAITEKGWAAPTVITQGGAEATYVVGKSAFLQRADSEVVAGGRATAVLRVVAGALLAVFPKGTKQTIRTTAVTAGIRGTGCYLQLDGERTYFCLCYGAVELTPEGGQARNYVTKHHDSPYWIEAGGNVTQAGFLEHTDAELTLLESLVGRKPPFSGPYKR